MVALVRASDIAYRDFHANIRRLQIDRGCSRERFQGAAACNPLPFLFSEVRIGSSIFADKLLDGINDGWASQNCGAESAIEAGLAELERRSLEQKEQ